MKTLLKVLIPFIIISSQFLQAQELTGEWTGNLELPGVKYPLVLTITQTDSGYTSTLKSPKQSPQTLPVGETRFVNDSLYFSISQFQIKFVGKLKNESITGQFTQMGNSFPLTLQHKKYEEEKIAKRPQDPSGSPSYKAEDVYFKNATADNIQLAGTLTLPDDMKNPPVAVLISGSGGQNRDEELREFNHRPFLVLADHLTRKGIAVLRFDDRGVGESQGSQQNANSADFASDVEAAVNYLKTRTDVDTSKIGFVGHSEGALIANLVITNPKNNIAFFVSLAGSAISGGDVLASQAKKMADLNGVDSTMSSNNMKILKRIYDHIATANDTVGMNTALKNILAEELQDAPEDVKKVFQSKILTETKNLFKNSWLLYFIKTNPADYIEQITIPTLVLNGEKDVQVLPELNLPAYEKALARGGNKDYTVKELSGLNHLFQTATTGNLSEYGEIEETFSPVALELIASWINQRF
ncbi:alpha/beta hydrolase family protein [Flavimarina sp. Hel_I_48]|uniref:alpha/beta hydrolase family protein n=1 Tax=Flavimarina sp. Hel_I_48 TaxID=1392488 RepID=UPI0004DF152E|nr:alpha/beta fold hydrolase [Flavimarina sp. Hel_I_48]